jgi:hypothetical protein
MKKKLKNLKYEELIWPDAPLKDRQKVSKQETNRGLIEHIYIKTKTAHSVYKK